MLSYTTPRLKPIKSLFNYGQLFTTCETGLRLRTFIHKAGCSPELLTRLDGLARATMKPAKRTRRKTSKRATGSKRQPTAAQVLAGQVSRAMIEQLDRVNGQA